MVEMFHPSQLEKRFGGEVDTPTNFWPPHMGQEFIPIADKSMHTNLMSPSEYDRIIAENPDLHVHPKHMKPGMI